jgi:hypothetical protein
VSGRRDAQTETRTEADGPISVEAIAVSEEFDGRALGFKRDGLAQRGIDRGGVTF